MLRITPLEIKQKQFSKALRGFEKNEVVAFLTSLSKEWERAHIEIKDIKARLKEKEQELVKLRDVEDSFFKAIKNAEETKANVVEQANKNVQLQIKEAQIKTDALLQDAQQRARNVLEQAEQKALETINSAQSSVRELEKHQLTLETHRDNLLNNLKLIAKEVLYKVERLEQSAPQTSKPVFPVESSPNPPKVPISDPDASFFDELN